MVVGVCLKPLGPAEINALKIVPMVLLDVQIVLVLLPTGSTKERLVLMKLFILVKAWVKLSILSMVDMTAVHQLLISPLMVTLFIEFNGLLKFSNFGENLYHSLT